MATVKRPHPDTETIMVEDVDALNCGVCYNPLKRPIFQCKEGHVLCSSCRDKLVPTGKCHVCGTTTLDGYCRCRAMERVVETVRGLCPNAAHGCDVGRLAYYDLASHHQVCPHARCYCPGEACGFLGTMKQLMNHITGPLHGWPCTTKVVMPCEMGISLQDGFNFLAVEYMCDDKGATATSSTGVFLFLLNVAHEPLGRAISVFHIHPHHTLDGQESSSMDIKCSLTHSWMFNEAGKRKFSHFQHTELSVKCTNLSDGLPYTEDRFKFVVPNSAIGDEDKEVITVNVGVSIASSC